MEHAEISEKKKVLIIGAGGPTAPSSELAFAVARGVF